MKRSLKALFSLALAIALGFALGQTSLASALEYDVPQDDYLGYLVILRAAPGSSDEPLLARRADEVPEQLTLISAPNAIYKSPDLASIRELVYDGRVALAEPDYKAELMDIVTTTPNDRYFNSGNYQYNLKDIHVQAAWDAGLSGNGVTVAVIDSGLNAQHVDAPVKQGVGRYYYFREPTSADKNLDQFQFTLTGKDGKVIMDENGNPKLYGFFSSEDTADDSGHGSSVAGVIAANTNNSRAIAGIASGVTILPIRCFTDTPGHLGGFASNLISGITYAVEQGADIINMSWGLTTYSKSLHTTINSAANAGCILIAAAGNDRTSTIQYPAAWPNVIGVGATDRTRNVTDFSQRNNTVHVFAPGSQIFSIGYSSSTAISNSDGTSFSAPTVAGVAALLLEADPQLTHSEFAQLLTECSDDVTAIDPDGNTTEEYTTAGLINVQKLIDRVGASTTNITAAPSGLTVQSCFHPSEAAALADPNYLILTAAYNSQGHLIESTGAQVTRSAYGGYQLISTFEQPDVALVRSFLMRADGTLQACLPPVERSVGQ
ncbi:MAG: S8 family serine peptidase [Muribaculaceae bacterium]|nr:S8 family serine peptidase [Muribaculaceae bacterium]